jgi:hypothetical protein
MRCNYKNSTFSDQEWNRIQHEAIYEKQVGKHESVKHIIHNDGKFLLLKKINCVEIANVLESIIIHHKRAKKLNALLQPEKWITTVFSKVIDSFRYPNTAIKYIMSQSRIFNWKFKVFRFIFSHTKLCPFQCDNDRKIYHDDVFGDSHYFVYNRTSSE